MILIWRLKRWEQRWPGEVVLHDNRARQIVQAQPAVDGKGDSKNELTLYRTRVLCSSQPASSPKSFYTPESLERPLKSLGPLKQHSQHSQLLVLPPQRHGLYLSKCIALKELVSLPELQL